MKKVKTFLDIYDKFVKKADKQGYAELLKAGTEALFAKLEANKTVYTATDVDYTDGYYIFGTGTNTVINFHIKEIPDWLFGIWWDMPTPTRKEKKRGEFFLKGTLFTQYEATIDKFKPSRSNLQETLVVCVTNNEIVVDEEHNCYFADNTIELLDFIHDEPSLAFCRDYCGWNYNREYHTRAEATREFNKYKNWQETMDAQTEILDTKVFNLVADLFKQEFTNGDAKVDDWGECTSPRYELVLRASAAEKMVNEKLDIDGATTVHLSEIWEDAYEKLLALWKENDKISDKYKFFWTSDFSDFVVIADESVFDKVQDVYDELKEKYTNEAND